MSRIMSSGGPRERGFAAHKQAKVRAFVAIEPISARINCSRAM